MNIINSMQRPNPEPDVPTKEAPKPTDVPEEIPPERIPRNPPPIGDPVIPPTSKGVYICE